MGIIIPTLRDHSCLKSAVESIPIPQADIVNDNTIFAKEFTPEDMDGEDDYSKNFIGDLVSSDLLGIHDLNVALSN